MQQGQFERRPVKQEELSWLSRAKAKKNWPPKNGHWQTTKFFWQKTAFLPLSPIRVKECQAAVYCGFSKFLAKSGRSAIFLLFISKLKTAVNRGWLSH